MDGCHLTPPRWAARRAIAAALTLLAIAGGAGTAVADDAPTTAPAARWPAAGPAVQTAMALGAQRWGFSPCHGHVAATWAPLDGGLNAEASWTNPADPYLEPSRNDDCAVTLSTRVDWDWPKLCSVVIHEVGHLAGHDHVADPGDIMYFTYMRPEPECTATPEPAPGPVPAPPPTAARQAGAPRAATRTARKTPRRKAAVKPAVKRRAARR
jgi:hypothetical protein